MSVGPPLLMGWTTMSVGPWPLIEYHYFLNEWTHYEICEHISEARLPVLSYNDILRI